MKTHMLLLMLAGFTFAVLALPCGRATVLDPSLQVVIIPHGEKPADGDNLSCHGEYRALQLPTVLSQKFLLPQQTDVPALKLVKAIKHARIF